jgi:hypothetical protein
VIPLMDKAPAQNRFQSGIALGEREMEMMGWELWVPSRLKGLHMAMMKHLD